ncbi:hypothetical protein M9435_006969 [Picochlorum sp. BPE23]|nr:hypothetical protein M9435_006969 [Picochlorum sp. BPE23]
MEEGGVSGCMVFAGEEDVRGLMGECLGGGGDASEDAMGRVHGIYDARTVSSSVSSFDHASYFSLLKTRQAGLGRVLVTASDTLSTQASLQQRAGKVPHGTLFVSDRQTGGKGRGGNTWASPEGCLMCSMSIRYGGEGVTLPFVQYLVSLAVVQTVTRLGRDKLQGHGAAQSMDVRIKWPNDIYDGQSKLKIGGVLCHSSYRDNAFFMTIGIGINVSNEEPTTCLNAMLRDCIAGKYHDHGGIAFTREEIVAGISNALEGMLDGLASHGFEPFTSEYYASWMHTGQKVVVREDDASDGSVVTIVGLTDQGYLLGVDDAGQACELHPDGNSFDFLNGLIKRKVPTL